MDWRLPRRRCARPIHEWRSSWTRIPTLDPDAVLDGWPFATKGGDNSVSSFGVGEDGKLTLIDVKRIGNIVRGRSGTAKSLAYAPSSRTLFVLHAFGPNHVRLMSVDADGKLTARPESYSVNVEGKPNRVATMVTLSPDEQFLIVGTTFDQPVEANPDGSPILLVREDRREAETYCFEQP